MNYKRVTNFIIRWLKDQIKQRVKGTMLETRLRWFVKSLAPEKTILLDYPVKPRPRWEKNSPHQRIYDILNLNRAHYRKHLESFLQFAPYFRRIPENFSSENPLMPHWKNGWLPELDSLALYSFVAIRRPKRYCEIGSGHSTKFVHKAITDHELDTQVISIDPHPRSGINSICDQVIRQPVEDVDLQIFRNLQCNDILFVDNSHRVFMNSDVTTVFMDVFPMLAPGVIVQFHDIFLPYDYPITWNEFYYSEQYLLAVYLLGGGEGYDILLPNTFVRHDAELNRVLDPVWDDERHKNVARDGASFWLEKK
jgi:hypothetical protein|tara:strand:+ start:1574 stop:2500 length:927 start_codon:yes stop_codon:yes gene_type:complete